MRPHSPDVPERLLLARRPRIVPIPGHPARVRENTAATEVALSADDLIDLDHLAERIGVQGERYKPAPPVTARPVIPEAGLHLPRLDHVVEILIPTT
ncbi:hypothetical protein [Nonomuraea longicatena]|uniref:Uncharacterized protein n=1 Tax=Nonomuraea longicatena TaxID=83682 RepID=A0ABP4ABU8_9ACTN